MDLRTLLDRTAAHAAGFLEGLAERPVGPTATLEQLQKTLGGSLPAGPSDPGQVVDELAAAAEPGLSACPSGRYFGFVIGGGLPAALAADWLTATWDQNAGLYAISPAAAVVEGVTGRWLAELLGLPPGVSFAFVTGCQMANFTALAAARHHVLAAEEWDVETLGLAGAPPIRVLAGEERHVTIDRALRYLGLGTASLRVVEVDGQGRMRPAALEAALAEAGGPTIVCAQVGNVNTGAVDPVGLICDAAHQVGAWAHVDGAFGLWAGASPSLAHLVEGVAQADSWATDGHKWLNVPYDSGLVFTAHPPAHQAALAVTASYLMHADEDSRRDAAMWTPEFSRRARAFPAWAAIRSLGRSGIAELVERCCAHARRFADRLGGQPGVEVCNEVVLNQVLVRFLDPAGGDHDTRTREVVRLVQEDGTCWLSGSIWPPGTNQAVMRISVSNWSTSEDDVDRSVDAILRCAQSVPETK